MVNHFQLYHQKENFLTNFNAIEMPDYILAKQSVRGKIIFGKPLLAVVEAKKDDFEGGWAQCLLEILQPNRSLQRNMRRKMAQVIRWIGEKGRCIHNIRGRVHVPYRSS